MKKKEPFSRKEKGSYLKQSIGTGEPSVLKEE
jgi:hypothetical protein